MGKIRAICVSERRGTKKHEVLQAELKEKWGIVGDAHAGDWHRQVSLLSQEKIEEFRSKGADIAYGDFGENLVVEGFNLAALPTGCCAGSDTGGKGMPQSLRDLPADGRMHYAGRGHFCPGFAQRTH